MIIQRVKTCEEELEMSFTEYYAILVKAKKVTEHVKRAVELFTIPRYLKHVKTVGSKKYVLLCSKTNFESNKDILDYYDFNTLKIFDVPNVPPLTNKQYEMANKTWPCYFYPYNIKKLDTRYLLQHLLLLQRHTTNEKTLCSSVCIIYDKEKVLAVENDTKDIFLHAVFLAVEKISMSKYGYLCTNLEAIVYNEPCIACAMAFVHGRIKQVYFLNQNKQTPTFSKMKICYNKSLNHRYDVYHVIDDKTIL